MSAPPVRAAPPAAPSTPPQVRLRQARVLSFSFRIDLEPPLWDNLGVWLSKCHTALKGTKAQ
eukprot:2089017-Amphidinium_carterae.1